MFLYVFLRLIRGPQIFTAGQLMNSHISIPFVEKKVINEDVRKGVRRHANLGGYFVKLYVLLTPDLVEAPIDEAHSLGIKSIGHLFLTS